MHTNLKTFLDYAKTFPGIGIALSLDSPGIGNNVINNAHYVYTLLGLIVLT